MFEPDVQQLLVTESLAAEWMDSRSHILHMDVKLSNEFSFTAQNTEAISLICVTTVRRLFATSYHGHDDNWSININVLLSQKDRSRNLDLSPVWTQTNSKVSPNKDRVFPSWIHLPPLCLRAADLD